MKVLIFDSGALINFSMNGILPLLEALKKNFSGKFMITPAVYYETVQHPIGVARFELGALQVQNLIDKKVIDFPQSIQIDPKSISKQTQHLTNIANHYLKVQGKWVPLVSEGEMSCLALSDELTRQGVDNIIAIDERTTRMLGENPANLEKLMSEKLHQPVSRAQTNMSMFARYRFIRSSELVYVAYKKGLVPIQGKKVLEALLYATKFKGCAVSFEEIEELKRL